MKAKDFHNKEILFASYLAQGMPYSALWEMGITKEDLDRVDCNMDKKLFFKRNTDETIMTFKQLDYELTRRNLVKPLPVVPPPTKIIVLRIKVERMFVGSKMIIPDTSEPRPGQAWTQHQLQAIVVAIGKDVVYPTLGIGSKVYLTNSPQEMITFNETLYHILPSAFIGCVVF